MNLSPAPDATGQSFFVDTDKPVKFHPHISELFRVDESPGKVYDSNKIIIDVYKRQAYYSSL